jgi:succinate dehydrogenase/fumarate reductase cytochrome b subunit
MRWDIFVMALAIWNSISIPFAVSFMENVEHPAGYLIFEYFVDICFAFDIIFAFRTTFINSKNGLEIVEARKIALNYIITGRFFVDLAASIPFEDAYSLFVDVNE